MKFPFNIIRILQILLVLVLVVHLALALLITTIGLFWKSEQFPPNKIVNEVEWRYKASNMDLKLSKEHFTDSTTNLKQVKAYLEIEKAWPVINENGNYFILDRSQNKLSVEYDKKNKKIKVALTNTQYRDIQVFILLLSVMYISIITWMMILLLKFSNSSFNNYFFTQKNVIRLRTIGWFAIGIGMISLFSGAISKLLFRLALGLRGINFSQTEVTFLPIWLIAGLTMLIIAKAFENGILIRQEQELTI